MPRKIQIVNESEDKKFVEDVLKWVNEAGNFKAPKRPQILKAIRNRKFVGIIYGHKSDEPKVKRGFRLIQPHALFSGYKMNGTVVNTDRLYLRAYVVMDTSKDSQTEDWEHDWQSKSKTAGLPIAWRLFRVDRIVDWMEFNKVFSSYRELYNPDDKNADEVIEALPKSKFPKGKAPLK